jgi:hypothetical protein
VFFAPSIVGSLGFSSKLKGFLGRAKIKDLFADRFKAIPLLGEELQSRISSSTGDFETQITQILQTSNLLDMKPMLKDGLFLLKEEGWFSESDYQTILSAI